MENIQHYLKYPFYVNILDTHGRYQEKLQARDAKGSV